MFVHRLLRSVPLSLLVLLFTGAPLAATEFHVAQDGSGDFLTIQQAADVAQAGDTVIIHQGVYPELVQPVHSGTAADPITYRGATGETAVIDGGGGARDVCIKVANCSHLTFEGLTLSGALWAGFYAEGPADNLDLDGLTCENNIHSLRGAGYGIWLMAYDEPISDCRIVNNEVRHNSSHGIFLYRSNHDILIDSNHVTESGFEEGHWGHNVKAVVWNEDDPETGPVGITITNNHLEQAITQGIMTWNARQLLIRGNHLHHNGATGIQIEDGTTGFVVENNLCEWNQQGYSTETGIWVDDASEGVVQNNVMRHNQVGLKVSKCGHVIFRRNLIYQNNRENTDHLHNGGVFLLAYDGITNLDTVFVHNTLHQIGNPAYANAMLGLYEYYGDTIEEAVFVNNIFAETVSGLDLEVGCLPHSSIYHSDYNNFFTTGGVRVNYLGTEMTWEEYRADSGQDANSITADPLFTNAVSGDFGLQAGSPCADSGRPLTVTVSSGSGTAVPVKNARFFTDGLGLIEGDLVLVGSAGPVRVSGVDYTTNVITVTESISWTAGAGVSYPWSGTAPDMGALESTPSGTVDVALSCVPASGSLPFSPRLWFTLTNLYSGQARRVAARMNLTLASGSVVTSWRAGWTNIQAGETFNRTWFQALPALASLVGPNVFDLIAEDVTPAPYNQPPYQPAGDTAADSCTVTGILP